MKTLIALLFSINIFACKCENMSLKRSFESAHYVFIGRVFEVQKTPSGLGTLEDYVSKVQIKSLFKGETYNNFYTEQATLFGSQVHSCDVIFDEKDEYLIFAYEEPDTGFLFSHKCLYSKKLTEISSEELITLESLSKQYKIDIENSKISDSLDLDLIVEDPFNQPNREIIRLNNEVNILQRENSNQKLLIIIIGFISVLLLSTSIWLLFRNRKLKSE